MGNLLVGLIIGIAVVGAIVGMRQQKKKGKKCCGCADAGSCGGRCHE